MSFESKFFLRAPDKSPPGVNSLILALEHHEQRAQASHPHRAGLRGSTVCNDGSLQQQQEMNTCVYKAAYTDQMLGVQRQIRHIPYSHGAHDSSGNVDRKRMHEFYKSLVISHGETYT